MTDKEQREQEKLKTPEDYILAIRTVSTAICNAKKADKKVDDILFMLAEALYDKYKYIIALSRPYRKKQSAWSKISDYFALRRERKSLKDLQTHAENEQYDDAGEVEEEEPSDEEVTSSPVSQILQLEKRVEVLENKSAEQADDDVLEF